MYHLVGLSAGTDVSMQQAISTFKVAPKNTACSSLKVKGKGKTIPVQTWTDPEGSRRVRFPYFETIGT